MRIGGGYGPALQAIALRTVNVALITPKVANDRADDGCDQETNSIGQGLINLHRVIGPTWRTPTDVHGDTVQTRIITDHNDNDKEYANHDSKTAKGDVLGLAGLGSR